MSAVPAVRPAVASASDGRSPGWLAWSLRFGAAFALLNALLTFENAGGGFGVVPSPRLSFELCLLLGGLTLWAGRRDAVARAARAGQAAARASAPRTSPGPTSAPRTSPPRGTSWLAAGFVLLVLARYVDVTMPALFGRSLNLVWDLRHLSEVLRLAASVATGWQLAGALLGFAFGLALLHRLVRWGVVTLLDSLRWHRPRPALLVAVGALGASFAAHPHVARDTRWFFALPLAPSLLHQAALLPSVLAPGGADRRLPPGPAFDGTLGALRGADVLVVFAESYGIASFEREALAQAMQPARDRLAAAVAAGGRQVVSARVTSPTFGGGSWLAHAALLSGIDTADPWQYERLLASERPTLVRHFARHGYRTVGWMPGLQRPWPEGAFYGFDRLAGLDAIGYAGAPFGYWRVPDQAALALLQQQELDAPTAAALPLAVMPRTPRFVVFPTLSTHAPFTPLAPYLSDWTRAARPDAYATAKVAPSPAFSTAYTEALRYQFDWLAGWFAGPAPRGLLTIVIGDHQPLAAVSGADASHDVPVHVIGDDPALLRRFVERGFVPGLAPPAQTLGPIHALTPLLLEVFDAAAVGERAATAGVDAGAKAGVIAPADAARSANGG